MISTTSRTVKAAPDALDRQILASIAFGLSMGEIARDCDMKVQSVEKRVHWMQANRWATFDRKLLSPSQRERIINIERRTFGLIVDGV